MMYEAKAQKTPHFFITNTRDEYWLEEHKATYARLKKAVETRSLTEKEQHLYELCFRALRNNNYRNSYR